MTFLNATLLFAVAAIGIPIALHLTARREPKQIEFPSIRLLKKRFETNRTKIRVRRWWLLALRILAIAAVALALAGPVIHGNASIVWSSIAIVAAFAVALLALGSVAASRGAQKALTYALLIAGGVALLAAVGWGAVTASSSTPPELDVSRPVALAIVVDNGPLSAWRENGRTQIDSIRQAAKDLLMTVHPESRLALIDRTGTPVTFALDRGGALSKVDAMEVLETADSLTARLDAALRLLSSSELESKQLVLIGDPNAIDLESDEFKSILNEAEADFGVKVTLWEIESSESWNRSLSVVQLSDETPAPNTSVTVTATVSAAGILKSSDQGGEATVQRITAELVLFPAEPSLPVVRDGKIVRPPEAAVDRLSAEVSEGQSVELRMTLPPLETGIHHGAIRLIGQDALAFDDSAYFTVTVLPPSRLLLAGDQPEELDELGFAITAPAPLDDPAAQYQVERVGFQDLSASNLDSFNGVVLIDPSPSVLEQPVILRYLESGGSLLVCTGDALGVDPFSWFGVDFERRWRVPEPGTFFEISSASHPALRSLASTPDGVPFQDFRISQYWRLSSSSSQVLLRYAGTGHPGLIERVLSENKNGEDSSKKLASAKLMVLSTPIPDLVSRGAWNELFSGSEPWPAFLMVRDLARYLSGRASKRYSIPVGAVASVAMPTQGESSNGDVAVSDSSDTSADAKSERRLRWQWFPSVGDTPVPIDIDEEKTNRSERVIVGQIVHSGVHWIRGGPPGLGFTANLDRQALTRFNGAGAEIEVLESELGLSIIDAVSQMEWTGAEESPAVSVWSPVMLFAMIAFLLEQILGNRFYSNAGAKKPASTIRKVAA
ncbi:MAG: BatA domain-containing protein [Planctomycetota bacterium]